jgi:hypothetical protein
VILCDLTNSYTIESAWFQRLKLTYVKSLSNLAFNFNLRRYAKASSHTEVGFIIQRCTFGEFFGELRELFPTSIPDDMDLASIGAALGAEIDRHIELHGKAIPGHRSFVPPFPFLPFQLNFTRFRLVAVAVSRTKRLAVELKRALTSRGFMVSAAVFNRETAGS